MTQWSQMLKWVCLGHAKFLSINLVAYSALIGFVVVWTYEMMDYNSNPSWVISVASFRHSCSSQIFRHPNFRMRMYLAVVHNCNIHFWVMWIAAQLLWSWVLFNSILYLLFGWVVSNNQNSFYVHVSAIMQAIPLPNEWKRYTRLTYGIAEDRVDSFYVHSMRLSMTFGGLNTEVRLNLIRGARVEHKFSQNCIISPIWVWWNHFVCGMNEKKSEGLKS